MAKKSKKSTPRGDRIVRDLPRAQLAERLGVHTDTVGRWHRRQNPPPHDVVRGRYLYSEVEVWGWIERERLTLEPGNADADDTELREAEIAKERALARRYECIAAREEGRLIDANQARSEIHAVLTRLSGKLMALGSELKDVLAGKEAGDIRTTIETAMDARLRECAAELEAAIVKGQEAERTALA